jgi:hypothetical protein
MSHQLPAALMIDPPVNPPLDLWSGEVRAYLRQDAPILGLAAVLIAFAILAFAIYLLRHKSNERYLVWFGALSCAYGLGMMFSSDVFHFTATVDKAQRLKWSYPQWVITYPVIPFAALLLSDLFPEWDRVRVRRLIRLLGLFAIIAIGTDLVLHRAGSFRLPYSAVVVVGLVAAMRAIPRGIAYRQQLRVAGLAFSAVVLLENLWRFHSTSFAIRFQELEALTFACWLAVAGAMIVCRMVHPGNQ